MMISDAMNAKLNEQITAEFSAAHQYLAMACTFDGMGFKILGQRFMAQQDEERQHAMKIVAYVLGVGGTVTLQSVGAPVNTFDSVEQIVKSALESEEHITKMINAAVTLAVSENDHATRSFLTWFVDEQVEEVASMSDLLQLVKLANGNILQVENRVRHDMMATDASQ